MRSTGRVLLAVTLASVFPLASALPAGALAPTAEEGTDARCEAMNAPLYQRVNPKTQVNLLTTSSAEAADASGSGFTQDEGVQAKVSNTSSAGLLPVHRLYRAASGDYLFTLSASEVKSAASHYGYVDQGTVFYAAPREASCSVPVHRYQYRGKHRLVVTDADRRALTEAGASYEGISFYTSPTDNAVPVGADAAKFTLAVIPPTQQEVRVGDPRWWNRTDWLVKNKDTLNLRFVTDTGDVANWGNVDHTQFQVVQAALKPLQAARVPYSLALGNHDTAAVCTGGGACDAHKTRALFRDTTAFNSYFNADAFGAVQGEFEPGKVDNSYSTFAAGGRQWLVLSLEMWPRRAAVDWAQQVVRDHQGYNVIVVTHQYTTEAGDIDTSSGYGETSGRYLFDNLISKYPNVKLVFNGHEGSRAYREDTGVGGNKVYTLGFHRHDTKTNPVQLVEVDTANGTFKSSIYAPYTNQHYPEFDLSASKVQWIG
jgi:hypothetical protein